METETNKVLLLVVGLPVGLANLFFGKNGKNFAGILMLLLSGLSYMVYEQTRIIPIGMGIVLFFVWALACFTYEQASTHKRRPSRKYAR